LYQGINLKKGPFSFNFVPVLGSEVEEGVKPAGILSFGITIMEWIKNVRNDARDKK
jgi:hypothetical protein